MNEAFNNSGIEPAPTPATEPQKPLEVLDQSRKQPFRMVNELTGIFSEAVKNGGCEFRIDGLPVTLTPLNAGKVYEKLPDDLDDLDSILNDPEVLKHIENAALTTPDEMRDMSTEIWDGKRTGEVVRWSVRLNGRFTGVINCATIDPRLQDTNPGVIEHIVGNGNLTGERATYHGAHTQIEVDTVSEGDRNTIAESAKQQWLDFLGNPDNRLRYHDLLTDMDQASATISQIDTGRDKNLGAPILSTHFAYAIPVMMKAMAWASEKAGIPAENINIVSFLDSDNMKSIQMVQRIGAKLVGMVRYPYPDGTFHGRLVTSLTIKDIDTFLNYAQLQTKRPIGHELRVTTL